MRSLGLIVNPISGRGKGPRVAERAAATLRAAGLEVTIKKTEAVSDPVLGTLRGNGPELARALAATVDAVIAVGGDGTLGEIVRGLRGSKTPAGIIPVGTANVVARELGIPRNPEGAARALLSATPRAIDIGLIQDRIVLAMVGVGIDGEIVKSIAEARRGPITMATYVRPAVRALYRHRPVELQMEVDGRAQPGPIFGVIISNTRNYGGIFSVTPAARLSDGWFDFQEALSPGLFSTFRRSASALLRRPAAQSIARYGRGKKFRITSDRPVAVQVDGDYFGTTPIELEVLEKAVNILAPQSPEDTV